MPDMIKEVKERILQNKASIGQYDDTPKDARSVFRHLLSADGVTAESAAREIITLSNLQMVSCMPPMGDNIVDPPPFLNTGNSSDKIYGTTRGYSSAFSTGLVGMDYIERNIVGGNFLVIVPLELKPSIAGSLLSSVQLGASKLSTFGGRLGIADYGLETKVATRRYWRSYTLLLKSAAIALGVDLESGAYTQEALEGLVPKFLYDNLVSKSNEDSMFRFSDIAAPEGERGKSEAITTVFSKELTDKIANAIVGGNRSAAEGYIKSEGGVEGVSENVKAENVQALISGSSYLNLLKYMTNIDDTATANDRLPIISFFINGTVERNFSTNSSIEESKVAKYTTDTLRRTGLTALGESGLNVNDLAEYTTELAYHGKGPAGASFALSNTSIPKVISDTATDFSYNVKLSDKAIGSDPISLLRPIDTLARILPFTTPVSDGRQNTVVPNAPLYCAAFIKGVMNVPRGAITSAQITTNPQFQTSEGVPTEIDIVLTIQPLLAISTMPDFGRFWSNTDSTALVASMFNPMSAFNVLATMCGYNTVLTKYPFSLFEYFVSGKISSIFNNLKGSANYISTGVNDFIASNSLSFGQRMMPS